MTGAQAHDPLAGRAGWLRRARSYLRAADPVLARLIDDRPDFDPRAWMTQLPAMDLFGALGHHRITVIHASLTLLARLCGDAFCTGEMRRQELSGSVQRRGRFVENRVIGLEDVRHPGVMSRVTCTSAVAACRARRMASSRRTSCVPAWMISGGRPDRSAKTGLIRPRAGSCPAV